MTSDPVPPPTRPAGGAPASARAVATTATLVEALVLVGLCLFYVIEMVGGATDDLSRAATSGVLILVFAGLLLVLAWGWRRGSDWPRTPTLLWNALLLPVAWSLHDAGRTTLALGVAALALVAGGAALGVPAHDPVN